MFAPPFYGFAGPRVLLDLVYEVEPKRLDIMNNSNNKVY
jgi:hypothetical protein